jgi:hypothetical protein
MTDYDKLNAIITKARMLRQSTTVTPNEVWLSDLIEALALAVREHDRQHQMTLIEPGGYPAEFYGTPYRSPTEESA